jgi:hypothetical protein
MECQPIQNRTEDPESVEAWTLFRMLGARTLERLGIWRPEDLSHGLIQLAGKKGA